VLAPVLCSILFYSASARVSCTSFYFCCFPVILFLLLFLFRLGSESCIGVPVKLLFLLISCSVAVPRCSFSCYCSSDSSSYCPCQCPCSSYAHSPIPPAALRTFLPLFISDSSSFSLLIIFLPFAPPPPALSHIFPLSAYSFCCFSFCFIIQLLMLILLMILLIQILSLRFQSPVR
jgi:hypothetical protein